MKSDNKKRLFVVGVGRSGTSLLQLMLASHQTIEFIPETGMVRHYLLKQKLGGLLGKQGEDAVKETVSKDKRLQRIDNIEKRLEKSLSACNEMFELDGVLYDSFFDFEGHELLGDKDPKLVEHINQLLYLWPESKIIHIFRDPRDVLVSKKKASWSSANSNFKLLIANAAQFNMATKAQNVWGPNRVHFVQYEELVTNPKLVMESLCQWLELPFDSNTLNHAHKASGLVAQDEMQWKAEVFKPVNSKNFNKWKTDLKPFEALCVQHSCSNAMSKGKYERVGGFSVLINAIAAVYGCAIKLAAIAYIAIRNLSNMKDVRKLKNYEPS